MHKVMLAKRIPIIVFAFFLFSTMAFSNAWYEVKLYSYIFLIFYAIYNARKRGIILAKQLLLLLPWYSYYSFSLLLGSSQGYLIDFELINNYFITPIAAILLANIIDSDEKIRKVKLILIIISLLIIIINFVFIVNSIGRFNIEFFAGSAFGSVVVTDETIEFRSTSHPALMFLLPYILVLYFFNEDNSNVENKLISFTLILAIVVVLLSGRRALQLVFALTAVLTFLSHACKMKKNYQKYDSIFKYFFALCVAVAMLYYFAYFMEMDDIISSIANTFFSAFSTDNESGAIRLQQSRALLNGFLDSPIFGNGLNAFARTSLRSSENPWSYEMVYLALLFQTGIFGTVIFFTYIYKITLENFRLYNCSSRSNRNFFLAVFSGCISFVIAGSSNPMIYFIWFWAIATICFNHRFINKTPMVNSSYI